MENERPTPPCNTFHASVALCVARLRVIAAETDDPSLKAMIEADADKHEWMNTRLWKAMDAGLEQ